MPPRTRPAIRPGSAAMETRIPSGPSKRFARTISDGFAAVAKPRTPCSNLSASEKTLRIDVHLHPDRAALLRRIGKQLAQIGLDIRLALAVDEQPEPVTSRDHRQRCLGRAQNRDVRHLGSSPSQGAGMRL